MHNLNVMKLCLLKVKWCTLNSRRGKVSFQASGKSLNKFSDLEGLACY